MTNDKQRVDFLDSVEKACEKTIPQSAEPAAPFTQRSLTNDRQKNRLVELIKECPSNYSEDIAEHLIANNVLALPHALGEKVWCLGQPCGGCECYNEPMTEEFIERCRQCDKWEIIECEFDYELIPEWDKYVFPTREKAEEALSKLQASYKQVDGGVPG